MAQVWLWGGTVGMAIGAVLFGLGAHKAKNERWRTLLILNFFIALIAAGLYLAMAMGQGKAVLADRPTYWIRYITWFCSTPLLILDLTYLGRTSLPITGSLLGANAYMLATGFAATISPRPINYVWYITSCAAFLAILYLLLQPYRLEAERQHPQSKRSFQRLLMVHIVLWTGYPIVWILSNQGVNLLGSSAEAFLYTLLDLLAKVGFGFLSLSTLKALERVGEAQRSHGVKV